MSLIPFHKYHGAGNDFILIDNRQTAWLTRADTDRIAHLCDRHFGIGADGLLLLQDHPDLDFEMVYFNSDGRESTMCGNGGRCIVAFAHALGIVGAECRFLAVDGPHAARLLREGWVELQMGEVREVEKNTGFYFLDTGSPHYVRFVDDLEAVDVVEEGRAVRYSDRFRPAGTNVNFVQGTETGLRIATYERGVEDETLACGTGVTAAAIAYYLHRPWLAGREIEVAAKGGRLQVRFEPQPDESFTDVWLCGPAVKVFEGKTV